MDLSRRSILAGALASTAMAPPYQRVVTLEGGLGPSLSMDFLSGVLDQRVTFTRASTAWSFDSTGTLQSAATNVPRFDYGIGGVTNNIRNNTMAGAAVGTPGTLPTNWLGGYLTGGTSQITSVSPVSGMPRLRTVLSGSPTATATVLQFDAIAQIAAPVGQTWTGSLYVQLNSGSLATGFSAFDLALREYDNASAFLRQTLVTINTATSTMGRFSVTATMGTSTAFLVLGVRAAATGAAVSTDLTISGPQLQRGTAATGLILTTSAAVTTVPTPQGLLIEDARTNGIRNNSMTGAAAGSPGTAPTNWTIAPNNGLTQTIVGFGTTGGLPYIDIRFSGTTTSAAVSTINEESSTTIAALTAQVWTYSVYAAITAGSTANITSIIHRNREFTSGGAAVVNNNSADLKGALTSSLLLQTQTTTLSGGATTAFISSNWLITPTGSGVAVDITLRLAASQLELGAFASSPILTTSAAVTRAAELATMPLGAWFNPSGHSAFCATMQPAINAVSNVAYQFDDGSTGRDMVYFSSATVNLFTSAGVDSVIAGTMTASVVAKTAGAFGAARQAGAFYGGAVTSGSSALATGLTTLRFGANVSNAQHFYGYLRQFKVWSRVLGDGELQAVST